jgi:hypothetical protein
MHRAGATLSQAATEVRIVVPQIVSDCIQQRHAGIGIDRDRFPIESEVHRRHELNPFQECLTAVSRLCA